MAARSFSCSCTASRHSASEEERTAASPPCGRPCLRRLELPGCALRGAAGTLPRLVGLSGLRPFALPPPDLNMGLDEDGVGCPLASRLRGDPVGVATRSISFWDSAAACPTLSSCRSSAVVAGPNKLAAPTGSGCGEMAGLAL